VEVQLHAFLISALDRGVTQMLGFQGQRDRFTCPNIAILWTGNNSSSLTIPCFGMSTRQCVVEQTGGGGASLRCKHECRYRWHREPGGRTTSSKQSVKWGAGSLCIGGEAPDE